MLIPGPKHAQAPAPAALNDLVKLRSYPNSKGVKRQETMTGHGGRLCPVIDRYPKLRLEIEFSITPNHEARVDMDMCRLLSDEPTPIGLRNTSDEDDYLSRVDIEVLRTKNSDRPIGELGQKAVLKSSTLACMTDLVALWQSEQSLKAFSSK